MLSVNLFNTTIDISTLEVEDQYQVTGSMSPVQDCFRPLTKTNWPTYDEVLAGQMDISRNTKKVFLEKVEKCQKAALRSKIPMSTESSASSASTKSISTLEKDQLVVPKGGLMLVGYKY